MKMIDKVTELSERIPDTVLDRVTLHSLDTLQQEHSRQDLSAVGEYSPYIITVLAGNIADLEGVLASEDGGNGFMLDAYTRASPPGEPNEIGMLATLIMLLEYGRYPACLSLGCAAMQSDHVLKEQSSPQGVRFLTENDMENYELDRFSNVIAVQTCTPCGRFIVATQQVERSPGAVGFSYSEPDLLHLGAEGEAFSYDIAFFYTAYETALNLIEQGDPITPSEAARRAVSIAYEALGN